MTAFGSPLSARTSRPPDWALLEIKHALGHYFEGGLDAVNFEHIYHCAHELLWTFPPSAGTVNEFRPVLLPFLKRKLTATELIDGFVADDCHEGPYRAAQACGVA